MKLPTLNQILTTISNECEFVVLCDESNEAFTQAAVTSGEWVSVKADAIRKGYLESEVAEVYFVSNRVYIILA